MRIVLFFFQSIVASAAATQTRQGTCTTKTVRKPWEDLTTAEKSDYVRSDQCLMELPAQAGIPGSQSRWDDLHYAHIAQADYIHGVGAFLPWHRYYVTIHEHLIRTECNYTGPTPYWNEPADYGAFFESVLFDHDTGFGGTGTNLTNCVEDGPFANTTLHFLSDLSTSEYCLTRDLNTQGYESAAQSLVDTCMTKETFEEAWNCLESGPHTAGHGGVGGTMVNVALSPGDPLFYLHHTYLDKIFWDWQSQNLTSRLTDIGGQNIPGVSHSPGVPGGDPGEFEPDTKFTNFFNDGGNVTTLAHTLWSAGVMGNVTIGDVMDVEGDWVCAEYF